MDYNKYKEGKLNGKIEEHYTVAQNLRSSENPQDISLMEVSYEEVTGKTLPKKGLSDSELTGFLPQFFEELGINPAIDTIHNVFTATDKSVNWVIPEVMRAAIKLGMNRAPIYPNIIRGDEPVNALKVQSPYINQSDAAPRFLNEFETIQTGEISYGSKEFKIRKMGRGLKLSDEMMRYSSIDVSNIFFGDFGVRLGYALDSLAVGVLQNGEQEDGSASAVVIGVTTVGTMTYKDLLRVWVRLSRMGKTPNVMVGGEEVAMDILDLKEFKKSANTAAPEASLRVQTPIPTSSSFYVHGDVSDSQVVILDPYTTMIKYTAAPLELESERIASNKSSATYATISTGFVTLFYDSRVILDSTIPFTQFPDYMNPDALALETVKYQ